MSSGYGRKFYDVLRIHIEQGTRTEVLNLNDGQKRRVEIIDDLYDHYRHNPLMDMNDYIRNKYGIESYGEIYNLTRALNFVISMMSGGQRDMQRFKANYYADRMARIGDATGDWKAMDKAVAHITKINALDQPDPAESIDDQIPKMGYMLTTRASDVKEGTTDHTPEQIAAMFKYYGVKRDSWQQMLDKGQSTADDYDSDGNYIHRGCKRTADQEGVEEAEILELEQEFEQEIREKTK